MNNNTSSIKNYFNEKACSWNENCSIDEEVLDLLFSKGSLINNRSILDVGCGTGILFNYYLKHNAKSITGIDISNNMLEIAKKQYPNIKLICDDIVNYNDINRYDLIVIYNTLPHIIDFERLLVNLKNLIQINGKIIIAFGQSREKTNVIHKNIPRDISFELPIIEELCSIISKYFNIEYSISNEDIYEIIFINKK